MDIKFLLRREKETYRSAVNFAREEASNAFYDKFAFGCKLLARWAGEKCFRSGYKPLEIKFLDNKSNWGTSMR